MNPLTNDLGDIPVVIVGGGPIGLALACDLGRRGIKTLLLEQRADQMESAKMIVVSVRTMELCRQLGLSETIRNWGFPLDHGLDSVFVTSLDGYELGRVKTPSLAEGFTSEFSPEREMPCPQTWFDPILKAQARTLPSVELRYKQKVEALIQDERGVTVIATDVDSGETYRLRAAYVVGCDGYSSTVRRLLGIAMRGNPHLDVSASVYLRIKNFNGLHDKGSAYRYVFVGEKGTWAVLTTMDGRDLWRLQLIGTDQLDLDAIDYHEVMRQCTGCAVEFVVEAVSQWVRKMVVADRFCDGRIYLAGDAAHAHPPNGGLGMNTGIQDAFDLGWKLAAVCNGWGGDTLLKSYDIERRPASARAAGESLTNFSRLTQNTRQSGLLENNNAGQALRQELGQRLVAENDKAWNATGVHLGYSYQPSPVIVSDGSAAGSDDLVHYVPSARPGNRAPHFWLQDGRSVLDLFGDGFALLNFAGTDVDTGPIVLAAESCGLPLCVNVIRNADAYALYEKKLVLVRPDGHVAWRGDSLPKDSGALLDVVRGKGLCISACSDFE